jgi:hypothetical protein
MFQAMEYCGGGMAILQAAKVSQVDMFQAMENCGFRDG